MSFLLDDVLVPWAASRIEKVEGIEHLPRSGPMLIVPNHISYFDPIVLFGYLAKTIGRKPHFMAITAHWQFPGADTIAKWSQTAFVDRLKPATVLDRMRKFIERGDICVIYPEGSRNPDPELKKGKTGSARLALWTRAPVIPIGITGPGTRSITRAWLYFFQKKKFSLRIGPSVPLDEFFGKEITKDLLRDATRKIMLTIGNLCGKTYTF